MKTDGTGNLTRSFLKNLEGDKPASIARNLTVDDPLDKKPKSVQLIIIILLILGVIFRKNINISTAIFFIIIALVFMFQSPTTQKNIS